MSLHVGLGAHVLVLPPVGHISTVSRVSYIDSVGRLVRVGLPSYIVRLDHIGRPCMHWSHTLVMVHMGLMAAREDHSREVVADWPSGGPILVSGSLQYVRHCSVGYWLPSACEVH